MRKNQHHTSLKFHFKDRYFWFDIFILIIFFTIGFSSLFSEFDMIKGVIKITSIVATLQLLGFMSFHLIGEKRGILIQGFLGGFISSTMTFLEFSRNEDYKKCPTSTLGQALLLATLAMMIQSILIILSLASSEHLLSLIVPFAAYTFCLILGILYLEIKNEKQFELSSATEHFLGMRPIIWKKVFLFSLIVISLIYSMRFLATSLFLPYEISAFLISLFEAHGVLAAIISEFKLANNIHHLPRLMVIVIAGQSLSKIILLWRSGNKKLILSITLCLTVASILSLLAIYIN